MPERTIALMGNPNVGKSTVFNGLTGLRQHTGNWPGKTVEVARGEFSRDGVSFALVDLPGCYSLVAHSAEEEVARDFLLFESPDAAVIICDASCLERNMNLALQVLEVTPRAVLCVNFMDEARKNGVSVDMQRLSELLGVPVCGCAARSREGLRELAEQIARVSGQGEGTAGALLVRYPAPIEEAVAEVETAVLPLLGPSGPPVRFVALRLLEDDTATLDTLRARLGVDVKLLCQSAVEKALAGLLEKGVSRAALKDQIVGALYGEAERICACTVSVRGAAYDRRQLCADRLLTSRRAGIPAMLLLLALVFWITLSGANVLSGWLSDLLFGLETVLLSAFEHVGAPAWLSGALVLGAYRVMAWVVAVMLPPMAIFFPLFTLLEDAGYLPRVAFNLDRRFKGCGACGKQALTMCMGLGCNAAGVTGCRIIDSPRERLIAILTNSLIPCNGRFPTLIAILSMFFVGESALLGAVLPALLLTGLVALGVLVTLLASRVLSRTVLRGVPSTFTLELPPYRRPQIGQVLVRSLLDRTLFVLGRAVAVAAPAGLLLYALANVHAGGESLLRHLIRLLDPFGRLLGMDGTVLTAFALGFPANEIVMPIAMMGYLSEGVMRDIPNLSDLKAILTANGWTFVTAICALLFTLMHWPCSTTCLTIHKETGSFKWTLAGVLLPTLLGMGCCALVALVGRIFT